MSAPTTDRAGRNSQSLALIDVAVDPADPTHILATSAGALAEGLFESRDGGESWQHVESFIGLLAWPETDRLYLVAPGGLVFRSADSGRKLDHQGEIGGQPAALLAQGSTQLYVALHDDTIKKTQDGGSTWSIRSTPCRRRPTSPRPRRNGAAPGGLQRRESL